MSSLDADPTPDPKPPDVASLPPSNPALDLIEPAGEGAPARRPAAAWIRAVTLAAGLAAGFGAWLLAEPIYGRFQPKIAASAGMPSIEQSNADMLKVSRGMTFEASLTFATLGAVLGLALGLAGGVGRGSNRAALAAGGFGLVLGAVGGFLAGRFFVPLHFKFVRSNGNDLAVAMLVQGAISAIIGALAGAAYGLGLGDGGRRVDLRFITAGLLGAVVGLVVYQMAGAVAFPLDGTTFPVSQSWPTRLFARAAVAGFAALGVMLTQAPDVRVS